MSHPELSSLYKTPQSTRLRSSSSSSIDDLPSEIIHEICMHLEPIEVANLRLLCRRIAIVGLHYLVPEAHLIVKPCSFARLDAQSRIEAVGQNIKSLFFETDLLCPNLDFTSWKKNFLDTARAYHGYPAPCYCGSEVQTTMRSCQEPTDEELEVAYGCYERFLGEQEQVVKKDCWSEDMGEVLSRMPNLRDVVVSSSGISRPFSKALRRAFPFSFAGKRRLYGPRPPPSPHDYAAGPIRSFLTGLYHAGSKIESLQVGSMMWALLDQSDADLEIMKAANRAVKTLDIRLFGDMYDAYGNPVDDADSHQWVRIARMGRLVDFLRAAPLLESLGVSLFAREMFWVEDNIPVRFSHVVGPLHRQVCWPKLQSAKFEWMSISEDELTTWCEKHSSSLRELRLYNVHLSAGSWKNVVDLLNRVMTFPDFSYTIRQAIH